MQIYIFAYVFVFISSIQSWKFGVSSLFDPSVKYTGWYIKMLLMKLPPPGVGPLYLNHHNLDINVIPLFEISSGLLNPSEK